MATRAVHETMALPEEAEETISDDRMAQDKTEALIDVQIIETHLRSLKDEYREVLIMKYLDELSTDEISRALEKTPGNVRVQLHRAMIALREVINANEHEGSQAGGTT